MTVREAAAADLEALLALYLHLHESGIPADRDALRRVWAQIEADPGHHILVAEQGGRIVSSCACVIVPNLTRGLRPYALIENVVTHSDYRGMGHATACLDYANALAEREHCYKIMLLAGSREDATLRFYEHAGYNGTEKTAFIQRLE